MKDEIKEIDESPYCEVCGTCGCIGCCGIRNFISEHIEGKTNCKNEGWIIQELINLCEYKDKVFEENERLNNIIEKLEEDLDYEINDYKGNIDMKKETLSGEFCRGIAWEADYLKNRIKELKEGE